MARTRQSPRHDALGMPCKKSMEGLLAALMPSHERSQPALSTEALTVGSTEVAESNVQNLRQTLAISREEAVNALRLTSNNVPSALQNELARIPIDDTVLRAILYEYLVFR